MGRLGKAEDRALTSKQERFAQEYLVDCCGAKAARRAGYSERTADRSAAKLLRHPGVAALLAEHAAEAGRRLDLSIKRIEQELACVAFVDPRDLMDPEGQLLPVREMPERARRAIRSLKIRQEYAGRGAERKAVAQITEITFLPKVEALRLAAQRLGMLIEKHELVGPASVAITIGVRPPRASQAAAASQVGR